MDAISPSHPGRLADAPGPDLKAVPGDLELPAMQEGPPGAGLRVRRQLPGYGDRGIYHCLYLPRGWTPDAPHRFPLLVEYPGNGDYADARGDHCSGRVEDCALGYGLSAGQGFVWLCLPFVGQAGANQLLWWGDPGATAAYCQQAVRAACRECYADPNAVILTGFSRGAIACSYIGLRDDPIADLWLGMIACSHFDGVRDWPYPDSDRASAAARLRRLKGRACLICDEAGTAPTEAFLSSIGVEARFTFLRTPFVNHSDRWVLRDSPARAQARRWLADLLSGVPGTHAILGRITDRTGRGIGGVRIESGPTHFVYTDSAGRYCLAGLIDSHRLVEPLKSGRTFTPRRRELTLHGANLHEIDFVAL